MAQSIIRSNNIISQPTIYIAAGDGQKPATADTYPRYEIRGMGVSPNQSLGIIYKPDSNTAYYNTLMDSSGNRAFGTLMLGWTDHVTVPANSDHVAISWSVPSDCRFLCWVGVASRGNVTGGYIEFMDLPSTTLWVENKVNYARDFVGYFLYCRGLNANP